MQSAFRVVAASAIIAAASLVIRADVTAIIAILGDPAPARRSAVPRRRHVDSLDAYRIALKDAPPDATPPAWASSPPRCALPNSAWRAPRPRSCTRQTPPAPNR